VFVFAYVLGALWLLLSPACLWLLFARGYTKPVRAAAAATLAALEAATIALGHIRRPAPPTAAGTIAPSAPAAAAAPAATAACPAALPHPRLVRLTRTRTLVSELTIYWPANAHECATAAVLVRHQGHRLRIWLHEGTLSRHHTHAMTLPVHVTGRTAALDLRLSPPLHARQRRLLAVDGRTGDRIPERVTES
jgi:hypothetical protein